MTLAWKITRPQVEGLINDLLNRYQVFAPVKKGSQFAFGPIRNANEAVLSYDTTILPPRKYFLPTRETLFGYPKPGADPVMPNSEIKPRVVFGIHTYDLHGIGVLKKVFMGAQLPDPYFTALYNQTYLVGVDFQDDPYKFARDMRSDGLDCEYDLFLGNCDNDFILLLGREKGQELLKNYGQNLTQVNEQELSDYLKQREANRRKTLRKLAADLAEFPAIFNQIQESIIWQQEADKCFSCGSCNTTCSTCYCFDIRDIPDVDTPGGKRIRTWDSCMLDVFAKVATGENFREKAHLRLKHRFNRKVWYLRDLYGRPACIGCGRCSRACKADINIVKVLNRLKEEYNYACSINTDVKK